MDLFSDIMVIVLYFSGSVDVFSDIMVIFFGVFFSQWMCFMTLWWIFFSGSVEVFSDIMVIFLLFFTVSGCVF